MDHAEVMNSCCAKAAHIGIDRLTEVERVVVLVSIANFEIELGGLDTFYYNTAGDEAVLTVDAFKAVGAKKAASVLRKANALFPDGVPPRERVQRFAGLEFVRELPKDPLSLLEEKVLSDDPDIFSLLCDYMDHHAEELQEHDNGN